MPPPEKLREGTLKNLFKSSPPWIGLFILCFCFHFALSLKIHPQASMDAAYYHIVADRFLSGNGLTEPFIWQYLKPYTEVTRPIDYWQPLGIIFYAAGRFLMGLSGEILLNHVLWALLAIMIFRDLRVLTDSFWTAFTGFVIFAGGGKFAFFVSTTDNVVFYAWFGYLLMRELSPLPGRHPPKAFYPHDGVYATEKPWMAYAFGGYPRDGVCAPKRPGMEYEFRGHPGCAQRSEVAQGALLGIVSGLMTLTRIEGPFFGFLSGLILLKERRGKGILALILLFLLTISPWLIRNQQVFGIPWHTNPSALFLQSYDDLFERGKVFNWSTYAKDGWSWVIQVKGEALRQNLLNFFLVPSQFFLFPFTVAGIILAWHQGGGLLLGFTTFFWLLNGLLFSTLSLHGTAFHISAALFPYTAIMCALGVGTLPNEILKNRSRWVQQLIYLVVIGFAIAFSLVVTYISNEAYKADLEPYHQLFSKIQVTGSCASAIPIHVTLLTGFPGVMIPSSGASTAAELAKEFNCRYLLFDIRGQGKEVASWSSPNWKVLYASPPLTLWGKP